MKNLLKNKNLKLIIFGGKGGSGKTTSATATALYLTNTTKKKILVVSTDPAPSLGDSFNIEIGNKITQIKENLWAIEFEAKKLLEDFRKKNLGVIKTLVERGTYLSQEDIEVFENLAIPGMDEIMAIIKIADLLKTKAYDLIILDTAPTGHTKVLLSLPQAMENWLAVMNLMQEKHRFLKEHWKGEYIKDECDKFLEETKADVTEVKNLLKNPELTEFVPVTIPEPMSILETEDLIKYLNDLDIKVENIIVNRILFPGECEFCKKRVELQEKYFRAIEEKFKKFRLLKMPLFLQEIRGKEGLRKYAEILFGEKKYQPILSKKIFHPKFAALSKGQMADFLKKDLKFIICGGKGGVGKTAMAGAIAIALAEKYKDKKIFITTTDPAHALSKIFEQYIPLDSWENPLKDFQNLFALEIDAQKMLQEWKNEYRQNIDTLFKEFVGGEIDIAFDRKVIEELMELSPPGLEELMALRKIIDLMKENKYDIYVLDSAASGHLLRFLELPEIIRNWLNSIFKILLKYRNIIGLTEIKEKLLELFQDIKRIQEILFGSITTEFVMISIAEEMGIREMRNLSQSLKKLNVHFSYIVLNMIQPASPKTASRGGPVSPCEFCLAKRGDQEKYVAEVKKEYSKKTVLIPMFPYDIKGAEHLRELSKFLFGGIKVD